MATCQSCMSAPFEWRCSDCFPGLILCKDCCRESHRQLPFHRIQKWTGEFFMPSWLREVGVILCLGHSGGLCPKQTVCHKTFISSSVLRQSRRSTAIMAKNFRKATTTFRQTNMWQLPIRMVFNLPSAAQILDVVITMEIQ
jgi:hypothetical protein